MKVVLVILQFFLFIAVFAAGSFLPGAHLMPMWAVSVSATRNFVLDGLVLTAGLFALILAIEALSGRLRTAGGLTTLAFVLAVVLGLAMKFGLIEKVNVPYVAQYHNLAIPASPLS